jgi:4'-phosphopantetheinyl transferase EntD
MHGEPEHSEVAEVCQQPLAALFGSACVCEIAAPELVDAELFADERAYIARAVPKRRAEFGTARLCARRALARLGVAAVSLVPEDDRAPRWPAGVVGSIAHTSNCCAVVAASTRDYRALGLDLEHDKPLSPEIITMICTPRERRALAAHGAREAVLYFSAKEAFYKCQYPLTRRFLDFQDVELEVDFARGEFRTRVLAPFAGQPSWLNHSPGRFVRSGGLVLCGVALEAEAP